MNSSLNSFGARLDALIEEHGLDRESAWRALKISRATLFNWLKRNDPPPSKKHRRRLVEFFNQPEDFILWGSPGSVQKSKTSGVAQTALDADETGSEAANALQIAIDDHYRALLHVASDDVGRLGWIAEQMKAHLAVPKHWKAPSHPDLVTIVPKTATGQPRPSVSQQPRSA